MISYRASGIRLLTCVLFEAITMLRRQERGSSRRWGWGSKSGETRSTLMRSVDCSPKDRPLGQLFCWVGGAQKCPGRVPPFPHLISDVKRPRQLVPSACRSLGQRTGNYWSGCLLRSLELREPDSNCAFGAPQSGGSVREGLLRN